MHIAIDHTVPIYPGYEPLVLMSIGHDHFGLKPHEAVALAGQWLPLPCEGPMVVRGINFERYSMPTGAARRIAYQLWQHSNEAMRSLSRYRFY